MKNIVNEFEYSSPATVEEALKLISQYDQDEKDFKVIAGGQSLNLLMKNDMIKPEYIISIKGLSDLDYIKYDEKEGLKIGGLTIHRDIEKSPVIHEKFKVLTEMENNLSSTETRNWGTLGGNIAHGDPGGDGMTVLIALNANIKLASVNGERTVTAEDFPVDYFETLLAHDELLTEIQVPNPPPHTGVYYTKFSQIVGDFAIAAVGVSITLDSKKEKCTDARIVLGNVGPKSYRANSAEDVLKGKKLTDDLLAEAGQAASDESSPTDSVDASAEYKKELVGILVKRVAKEALERARKA